MRKVQQEPDHDNIAAGPLGGDADHGEWAVAKIEAALAEAKARPESRIPEDEVWKMLGLEP